MEQISTATHRRIQAGEGEVIIDGRPIPIKGPVRKQDLARFQSKITFGDYSFDSDPLLSTYNISSLTGGIGNEILKEGVDDETYWTGTLETRYPGQITLLPYTHEITGPTVAASQAYPLADFPSRAPSLWVAFDTTVARWNPLEQEFGTTGSLPTPPVGKGVEFENLLYIPLGEQGYVTMNADGDLDTPDPMEVVAFCLWDNKLAALTVDGHLRIKSPNVAWEAETDALQLPSAAVPRGLVVFANQQGTPTLYLVTNIGVWAYGRDEAYLYSTQLQFPPHPDQGRASANWRGESMYVSVGLGIHSYNGGIIGAMGPDGRYGLPAHLRGIVVDLAPEYNSLIALVQGERVSDADEVQDVEIADPMYEQSVRPFAERNAYATVLRFNGHAWHPVWEAPDVSGLPSWVMVSRANNDYLLWWGYAGKMYYQKLPYTFNNPKQGLVVGINEFASKGRIITGWMDADMPMFWKLLSHMEVVLDDPTDKLLPLGRVRIDYQYDYQPSWQFLGEAENIGMTPMPFGVDVSESSDGFSWGLPVKRIRFRISMESDDMMLSPVLQSINLKFIKIPITQMSFQFNVDLTQAENYKFQGADELAKYITSRASSHKYSEFTHRDGTWRIRLSQSQATDQTGYDMRTMLAVSAVEVVLPEPQWVFAGG